MSDFVPQLREQVDLLEDYSELYDSGKVGHALSISRGLDVILQMLQSQTGGPWAKENGVRLLSNARARKPSDEANGYHPLAPIEVETVVGTGASNARFVPVLSMPASIYANKPMKIAAWAHEIVLISRSKHSLTRRKLIQQVRNKAGGAHPHSEPEPDYKAISGTKGLGLYAFGPQGILEYKPPAHIATMRHMAHEVLVSLRPLLK